jgi:hypothetical protein
MAALQDAGNSARFVTGQWSLATNLGLERLDVNSRL